MILAVNDKNSYFSLLPNELIDKILKYALHKEYEFKMYKSIKNSSYTDKYNMPESVNGMSEVIHFKLTDTGRFWMDKTITIHQTDYGRKQEGLIKELNGEFEYLVEFSDECQEWYNVYSSLSYNKTRIECIFMCLDGWSNEDNDSFHSYYYRMYG